jgi:hypothetical protein
MPAGRRAPTLVRESRTETEEAVHETYRMLGREHELDLEREARKRRLAVALHAAKPAPAKALSKLERHKWGWFMPRRLAALLR